jgi:drug/metabolite transporter (DMT)-like permease
VIPVQEKATSRSALRRLSTVDRVHEARAAIRQDAATRWGVRGPLAELLFAFPLVGAVLFALASVDPGLFLFLAEEDSLLEWTQIVILVSAAVLATLLAARAFGERRRPHGLAYIALAAGCVFVAGEEVSWGQRILGLETPETLAEINRQDELTLHNIDDVRVALKFFLIGLGLAGFALPWLLRRRASPAFRYMPPLFMTSAFLVVAAYFLTRLVLFPTGFFGTERNFKVFAFSEWPELLLGYVVCGVVALRWRLGHAAQGIDARGP